MFILIFFLVISISQFISNKMINLSDDSEDAYTFTKKDSLTIVILFAIGIILQIVSKRLLVGFYWVAAGIYLFASLILILVVLQSRKEKLLKQREEMQQVYEILQKLVDKKGEGLDFNNPPFTLDYKYGNIQRITVSIDPTTLNITDKGTSPLFTPYLAQLDSFLPTYKWTYDDSHLSMRYLEFIGEDKPPERAPWPGSWLRYFRFMPMGIAGKGEVGFKPDSVPKYAGRSQYLDDSGNPIPAVLDMPNAPQGMISGAPLGLNTIIPTTKGYKTMATIEVGDYVFDINNKPVKVLGKSEINYNPDKVYRLSFNSLTKNSTDINIISDSIHKFPLSETHTRWTMTSAEDLKVGLAIMGNAEPFRKIGYIFKQGIYSIRNKIEVEKQPVQCILVDSDEHLFLITDESHIHEEWKGGNSYPYEAVYTRNTGGGKSVAVSNVVMHCLEHKDKIALALIDPKNVEFNEYRNMDGIVGVATNTLESVEILRIARQVMLKRNREMAEMGIKNIGEYTPTKKSGKVYVTGRECKEEDIILVKIEGQEKQMRCSEVVEYLHEDPHREIEVSLVKDIWLPINSFCCDYIYEDEMKMLLVIVDELAELTIHSGMKTAAAKEEDALKDEIITILTSIAQLGRSAAVHVICCTQKPLAQVIPTLLRDNLVFKCFCGKATSPGASDVALGNTLATTIDNTFPGAGIIQAVGKPEFCRYYFSQFKDLYKYYDDRGLDKKGYTPGMEEEEVLQTLEGTEEFSINDESVDFDFEGEKAHIDKKQNQIFEEI